MRSACVVAMVVWGGWACTPARSDSAASADAGRARVDAGLQHDAGTTRDGSVPDAAVRDAGLSDANMNTRTDASSPPDAGALPDAAAATDAAAPPDAAPSPDAGAAWEGYGPAGTPIPIIGFGAGTRGGFQDGGDAVVVTSLDDDGPGTLREALRSNGVPRVVTFAVDGVIPLSSALVVPSNITVDGREHDVTLSGKGLVIPGSDEVIITSLTIAGVGPDSEDGIQIGSALPDPSEHVVIDHVTFLQAGDSGNSTNVDEAMSVVFGSTDITVAWCAFLHWEKVMLFGNGDAPPELDARMRITVHHSRGEDTGRRHPQARHGTFHFFNNAWEDWRMWGPAFLDPYPESFGAQAQDGARLLVENTCVFRVPHAFETFSQADDVTRCESGGDIVGRGFWVDPATTAPLRFGTGCAGTSEPLLTYTVVAGPADAALRDMLRVRAGNTLH